MSELLFIAAFALLNCFRGRGIVKGDRWIATAGMGACAWLYTGDLLTGVAVFAGMYLWAMNEWFKMISAISSNKSAFYRSSIEWIDRLCDQVFLGKSLSKKNHHNYYSRYMVLSPSKVRAYASLWGSLRGLYLLPLFMFLTAITGNPLVLLATFIGLAQGPCYWIMHYVPNAARWGVAYAELLCAAIYAAALVGILA